MTVTTHTACRWLAAAGIALGAAQAAVAVPVLSLTATPQPAAFGSTVTVAVSIADIADLYAWQFSLSFDPALLQATASTEGPFLGTAGGTFFDGGTVDNTGGRISFVVDTLVGPVPGASGSGVIASFVFDTTAAGTGVLRFSDVLFVDSALATLAVQSTDGSVTVVPEPSSALLLALGVGLGGLGMAVRRGRVAVDS